MLNPSYGKRSTLRRSDGYWEKFEYDVQGNLWRIQRPWEGSPAVPEDATSWDQGHVTVINNFADLSEQDYEVNQNSTIFINGIVTQQQFSQKVSDGFTSVLTETFLRHRKTSAGEIEAYYVTKERHYNVSSDGTLTLRLTMDENGVRKAYRGGVVGKMGASGLFEADPNGTLTAYVTALPLDADGNTIPQQTTSHFAIKNAFRQHVLEYDLMATTCAPPESAGYATLRGTRFHYDAQNRIIRRTTLTGVPIETTQGHLWKPHYPKRSFRERERCGM